MACLQIYATLIPGKLGEYRYDGKERRFNLLRGIIHA